MDDNGLVQAKGATGFQPPAFQLKASGNPPATRTASAVAPKQLSTKGNTPVQRTGIELTTDTTPWDPIDDAKNYQEYNDIAAGGQHVGDVNDKIGTHGLFNCCAIVIAVHIKCGKNNNDNRWVVGMHHFSGNDRRNKPGSRGQTLTFEDAYNDLREDTETQAANLGQIQSTRKVLIPGTASQCHFPAIQALEQKMMNDSHEEAFNNDWHTLFNSYQAKSVEMQGQGNPLRCTAVQVRPGKFKKSNLKVIHKFQPQYGKDQL